MPVRRNVLTLSGQERAALVAAIKAVKTSGRYDTYVLDHSRSMQTLTPPGDPSGRNAAHRGPAFGPWHREFLRRFELDLGMPLPYWDWAADQATGSPNTAAVWGPDLMGGNGVPPDERVVDGPFAHDPADPASWSTIQDPATPDPSVPWLTRNFGGMGSLPTPQDVADVLNVTPYDVAPWNATSSPSFCNQLEGWIGPGLHNAAHMWVGGSMMPATSPNDPVFFLHHANVDRIWANWQRKMFVAANGGYAADYQPAAGGPSGHNLNDPMSPWGGSATPASVLDFFAIGYWYDDAPAPDVTAIAPATGPGAGGTTVEIQGSGFLGATAVYFGANSAITFNVETDTLIRCDAPMGVGVVDVVVETPVARSGAGPGAQFTYAAAVALPRVTGLTPSSGDTSGGDSVVISGSRLGGATAVTFGATPALAFAVDSDSQVTSTSPPGGAGTVDVSVSTPAGSSAASAADQFTYVVVPVPEVTGVTPSVGSVSGGDTVVIVGTGFSGATEVTFDGVQAAFTVDSDSQITVQTPPGSAGTVDVGVRTPGGASPGTQADRFTYVTTPVTAPQIAGLNPSSGSGGETVIVSGSGFTGTTNVAFGTGSAPFSLVSDTEVRAVATAPTTSGPVDVRVTTPLGTSPIVPADEFTYVAVPTPPTVTGLNPASGDSAGGDTVVITGTGFTGATIVTFATSAAFVVDSDVQITATTPPGFGSVDVVVTTPAGGSATGPGTQFTYMAMPALPVVTGLSPNMGSTTGGETVVITGLQFIGATDVSFDGVSAPSFTVDSDTQITAESPASPAGTVDVLVTTPDGTSSPDPADQFMFM